LFRSLETALGFLRLFPAAKALSAELPNHGLQFRGEKGSGTQYARLLIFDQRQQPFEHYLPVTVSHHAITALHALIDVIERPQMNGLD
jgi:hypothetical protein